MKDIVEKAFNKIKSSLALRRIRVHSSQRIENKIFIGFLSLILLSKMHKVMKNYNIYSKYTVDDIFDILSKLKTMYINNNRIQRPITKDIKTIFKQFEIPEPK
jgi:transposase